MLPRRYRLTTEAFEKVKKKGRMLPGADFGTLLLNRGDREPSRFGFIVSGKISGKAHERNRVKRLLGEIIAGLISETKKGYDLLFLVKKDILGQSRAELKVKIRERMAKNGLLE